MSKNIQCIFNLAHIKENPLYALFRYDGITFNKCTFYDSKDGQPWCSTQVYTKTREAVRKEWGVCQDWCEFEFPPAEVVQLRAGWRGV